MSDQPTASDLIMMRLIQEAEENGSPTRLGTLARLKEACDDILSGQALEIAREHGWNKTYFRRDRRLVPKSVGEYRRMKNFVARAATNLGPTHDTIAHDEDLLAYVRAREAEQQAARRPLRKGTRARRSDDIIAEKLDFNEQAVVRAELEDGRLARRRYDTIAAFFHKLSGVDLGSLERFSFDDVAKSIRGQLNGDDRQAMSNLVSRLSDDELLMSLGLIRDSGGGIRIDWGPGTVLVRSEEMRVLIRIAGLNPEGLKPIN